MAPPCHRAALGAFTTALLTAGLTAGITAPARAEIEWNPFAGELFGSLQYATSMVELGGLAGMSPVTGSWGTGFHYQERGSLLAQMAFGAASGAGAGARAVQTGKDQTYMVDASPQSSAGFNLDVLLGDADAFTFDLFYAIPFGSDRLPVSIDFGVSLAAFTDGDEATTDQGFFGFVLNAIVPATRFAQIEGTVRAGWGPSVVHGELHVVGNLGNRFYVRAGGTWLDGIGVDAGLGIRL